MSPRADDRARGAAAAPQERVPRSRGNGGAEVSAARPLPSCDEPFFDVRRVQRVRRRLPPAVVLDRVAETFRALGDPTRARIAFALLQEELCVHDLAALLGLTPSATSHQLRRLRDLRLVRHRKVGKIVYYALDDDHIRHLYDEAFRHVREEL